MALGKFTIQISIGFLCFTLVRTFISPRLSLISSIGCGYFIFQSHGFGSYDGCSLLSSTGKGVILLRLKTGTSRCHPMGHGCNYPSTRIQTDESTTAGYTDSLDLLGKSCIAVHRKTLLPCFFLLKKRFERRRINAHNIKFSKRGSTFLVQ